MSIYFTDGALFADIPGLPTYFASDYGEIFRFKDNKFYLMKQKITKWRKSIGFYIKDKKVYPNVHKLILEAFVGPCPPGLECCHNDGNPHNNKLDNLRWDTKKANWNDRRKHGTTTKFRKAKLNKSQVYVILRLIVKGLRYTEIAKRFNVSPNLICRIKSGKGWPKYQKWLQNKS